MINYLQSGSIQCFDAQTLCLLDEVPVSQTISHLCCSPTCSQLAMGTEGGAILTVDPLQLTSSLQLAINHLNSELVALDVLCPGSEHCVVCNIDTKGVYMELSSPLHADLQK